MVDNIRADIPQWLVVTYSATGFATLIGPLINYGLAKANTGVSEWQPMVLFNGSLTIVWSVVLFVCLPDDPKAQNRFRTERSSSS